MMEGILLLISALLFFSLAIGYRMVYDLEQRLYELERDYGGHGHNWNYPYETPIQYGTTRASSTTLPSGTISTIPQYGEGE